MTFTKACRIAAIIIVTYALLSLSMGLSLALGSEEGTDLSLYIGKRTPGQVIDHAIYKFLVGVALGTLSEISRALRSK